MPAVDEPRYNVIQAVTQHGIRKHSKPSVSATRVWCGTAQKLPVSRQPRTVQNRMLILNPAGIHQPSNTCVIVNKDMNGTVQEQPV